MPEHEGGVRPLRFGTHFDPDLQVRVSKVSGYRAECKCGWRGRTLKEYGHAGTELILHKLGAKTPDEEHVS